MKTADNYSSYQLDRLVQEIEGRLNDYEGGISEKDETIKSFAFFIGECAKNAVNNALAEHDAEIIKIIDEMIKEETDRANISQLYPNRHDHKKEALTELKEKIKKWI